MIFGHSCLGTADYIAPEQSIDSFAVDTRADIYSLGCTLYVLLTGKLPYPMPLSTQKLEGHRFRDAPPIRESAKDVPAELAAIVDKMMAKDPADRYQTMAEVVEALASFSRHQPVEFDFPKILAWRAKLARRRFAGNRRTGDSSRIEPPRRRRFRSTACKAFDRSSCRRRRPIRPLPPSRAKRAMRFRSWHRLMDRETTPRSRVLSSDRTAGPASSKVRCSSRWMAARRCFAGPNRDRPRSRVSSLLSGPVSAGTANCNSTGRPGASSI